MFRVSQVFLTKRGKLTEIYWQLCLLEVSCDWFYALCAFVGCGKEKIYYPYGVLQVSMIREYGELLIVKQWTSYLKKSVGIKMSMKEYVHEKHGFLLFSTCPSILMVPLGYKLDLSKIKNFCAVLISWYLDIPY